MIIGLEFYVFLEVGIGAFVMNEDGAVLAVQERSGPLKGTGIWKIPTGLLDRGEDVPDGAIREVLEETVNLNPV